CSVPPRSDCTPALPTRMRDKIATGTRIISIIITIIIITTIGTRSVGSGDECRTMMNVSTMQVSQAKLDSWVQCYGTSSNSYVLLEGPKSYFTSPVVDGFLAYQVRPGG